MCGIAGIFSASGVDPAVLGRMAGALAHRGPDDEGEWIDQEAGIGLAHRRLAILDLTPAGRQPVGSRSGRFVLTFNGEIYNHLELRGELEAMGTANWVGHCDSETLVEAIAAWGLQHALERCVGMFALALWDRENRQLSLARDRFGEKPLYVGYAGRDFVFASELRPIAENPAFERTIDRAALAKLTARGYIPAPWSIFEGVRKLEPASILTLDADDLAHRRLPRALSYWSYHEVVRRGFDAPIADEAAALEQLEFALGNAVKGQSVADVPVGLLLSGGVDSSSVLAMYRAHLPGNLRTYSVSFEEAGFDEAPYARAVADHFGTEHSEFRFGAAETLDVIPGLGVIYDEPFADPAGIPTYLISKVARTEVTVALTGDGADELLGGYTRYQTAARLWESMQRVPAPARKALGRLLQAIPPAAWDSVSRKPFAAARLQRTFSRLQHAGSLTDIYRSFRDEWTGQASPVIGAGDGIGTDDIDLHDAHLPAIARMMFADATSYLPGDLLCKTDRATMACSLEARLPFLDHRVAEVAAGIAMPLKVAGGTGKAILRKLLCRHAPAALFDRPKAGFSVPIDEWLRGPLKAWAEDLLNPQRLTREGYFDAGRVRRLWQDHLARRRNAGTALWATLMFEVWLETIGEWNSPIC
ncbi:MAG TPA: asparagine synthase (glutamine-hydrolyzing) [Croceibacterium sp.]|nr:asparagine synthase (glutamine-hydrolyzing) [Croceibacterium sp.]